jgi:hypothetical protein
MQKIVDKFLPFEYDIAMLAERCGCIISSLSFGSDVSHASQASTESSTKRLDNRKVVRPFSFGRLKLCLEQREHEPAKTRQQSPILKETAKACHRGNNAGKRSDVKQLAWTAKWELKGLNNQLKTWNDYCY